MVKKLDDRPQPRPVPQKSQASAPVPKAPAAPKPASTGAKFARDELSTGRTSALRAKAMGLTGATLVPTGAPTAASVTRTNRAVNPATAGLPADTAQRVEASAQAVRNAGANLPAGQRERAMAEELERQSAQFRGDPAAGAALARTLQPELDAISQDLSRRITANDDSQTHETVWALAGAAENLGATAALEMGRSFARAIPDVRDLNQFDDALANAGFEGEPTLLLATTQAFMDAGKGQAVGELEGDVRSCGDSIDDRFVPVDPNSPDAAAEAQLRVIAATQSPAGGYGPDAYAQALRTQYEALKSNPAALKAFADAQGNKLVDLARSGGGYSQGGNVDVALKLAEASGPARLAQVADAYASTIGPNLPELNSVAGAMSPASAAAVANALNRAGKADCAEPFAARAADALGGVTAAARAANDRVGELQAQLNQELAKVGPALTPEQRTAYQAEFWKQHQSALDDARTANAALQAAVTQQLPTLQALAPNSPQVAQAVADSLKELARDPAQNAFVVSTVENLRTNGAFPASFAGAERTLVEAYAISQQARAGQLITQGDTAGAAQVLEQVGTFLSTTTFQSQDVRDFVQQGLPTIRDFTAAVSTAARTGDLSAVRAWLEDPAKAKQLDALSGAGGDIGKALAEVVTGTGVAVYLSKAATTPSEVDRLVNLVKAGNMGAKALAFGFNALAKWTNTAVSEALKSGAGSLGALIGKVTPIVGLGLSIFDAVGGIGAAVNNPNIATIGTAIGNSLSAIGGAVALFPGGQGVGLALAIIGKGVGLLAGLIQGAHDEQARRDETQRILETIFAQPGGPLAALPESERKTIAERLAQTRADLAGLATAGGLSPADVISLAREFPEVMDPGFGRLAAVARATGAQGAALVQLLRDAKAKQGESFASWMNACLGEEAARAWDERAYMDAQGEATRAVAQNGGDFGAAFQAAYERLKKEYEARAVRNFLGLSA